MIIFKYCVNFNGTTKEFPTPEGAEQFTLENQGVVYVVEENVSDSKSQVVPMGEKYDDGYYDAVLDIKLKVSRDAQAKFTSAMVLINTALMVNAMMPTDETDFWDYKNVKHTTTVSNYIGLMLRYGQFIKQGLLSE